MATILHFLERLNLSILFFFVSLSRTHDYRLIGSVTFGQSLFPFHSTGIISLYEDHGMKDDRELTIDFIFIFLEVSWESLIEKRRITRSRCRGSRGYSKVDKRLASSIVRVVKDFGNERKPTSYKSKIWLRTSVENYRESETPTKPSIEKYNNKTTRKH